MLEGRPQTCGRPCIISRVLATDARCRYKTIYPSPSKPALTCRARLYFAIATRGTRCSKPPSVCLSCHNFYRGAQKNSYIQSVMYGYNTQSHTQQSFPHGLATYSMPVPYRCPYPRQALRIAVRPPPFLQAK